MRRTLRDVYKSTLHANFDEMCDCCGVRLLRNRLWCGACVCVVYCSPVCQKDAWPSHKTVCTDLANTFGRLRPQVVPTAVEAEIVACLDSKVQFADESLGVLQLLDGCSGMDSFRWQFVRSQNPEAAFRLQQYRAVTLPRRLWCALVGCEAWGNLLRIVLSVFIDVRDGCYRGAACFPVADSSAPITLQTRMFKRELTREQARKVKILARRLHVKFLALVVPRGSYWHDRLVPIPKDGMKGVVTLVAAGRESFVA